MKKNILVKLMMVAMVATMCMTFTACGGGDDDTSGGGENLTVGVHRVEMYFSDNAAGWAVNVTFAGARYSATNNSSTLYEDDVKLPIHVFKEARTYKVYTDNTSQSLCCMANLRKRGTSPQPVTITMKGFVNGQQKKEKTYTIDGNHSNNTIVFYSEINDGDTEQYLDM